MKLKDEMGHMLPAIDVFSTAIKYLVDDMYSVANDRISGVVERCNVHWVITVPATWTDSAKQFMRNAGERAGIHGNKLSIALEPEVASIFCRYMPVAKRLDTTGISVASFPVGTRYMVLDAGGGTIDITVHEVQKYGAVKEVKAASGGGWGGTLVDQAFEQLLVDIVDMTVYDVFKKEQTEDWLDLWRDFEIKKRNVSPDKDTKVVLKIPLSMFQIYERKFGKSLADATESSAYGGNIQFKGDKMRIEASVFKRLFDTSLLKTIQHTNNLLHDPAVRKIKAILMVGGFSASKMLQQKVKSSYPDIDVIIPTEASSSILRGALIFGHSPKSVTERVLKYTYGIGGYDVFKKGYDHRNKLVWTDKGPRCKDVFYKHAERNQAVKVGEPQICKSYYPVYRHQTKLTVPVYASELKDPEYTDVSCTYVGEMTVNLLEHDGDLHRAVWLSLTFSGTEIVVTAVDDKTGEKTKASINFLG